MPRKRIDLKVKLSPTGKVSPNLDVVLRRSLSPATLRFLQEIVRIAVAQEMPIYLVGGFVRDLFLGIPSSDLDLVVEGDAIRLGRAVAQRLGGRVVAHKPFGTAAWWLPASRAPRMPEFIDFISARSETYAQPAALPTVRFADLRADQARRDFSINTLALRLDGVDAGLLLDPLGGLDDLQHGLLRVLHDESFSDDPTRIFRLLRFAGRLNLTIEAKTRKELKASLQKIKLLSGERIRNELTLVLLEVNAVGVLRSLQSFGVLRQIHPALHVPANLAALLKRGQAKPAAFWELPEFATSDLAFVLWLLHLRPVDAAAVATRLRLSEDLKAAIVSASRLRMEKRLVRIKPSQLVTRLEREPVLALYALGIATRGSALSRRLEAFAQKLRHIQPRTNGNALQHAGLKPGPAYKHILSRLRAAWLDGEIRTRRQEQALLEQLLHEHR